jgi:hypothetical protein
LFSLIKDKRLQVYPNDELKKHCTRANAIETDKGWRISKSSKRGPKIDLLIASAIAAYGAVQMPTSSIVGLRLVEDFTEEKYSPWEDDSIWESVNLYT